MRRFVIALVCTGVFLACFGLRLGHWSTVSEIRHFPDTPGYLSKASWPLWSWRSWSETSKNVKAWVLLDRSLTVPLLYKLLGRAPRSIGVFQLLLSIACWAVLALFVARAAHLDVLKPVAFLIVLLFSLCDQIIMWDGFLLSDSVALSLMVLLVASWMWILERWHWSKALVLVVIAFLWTFTRDTNAWAILMLALLLALFAARSRGHVLLAVVFVVLFAANEFSQNAAKRWVTPFVNVVGLRVLPDAERTAYFARLGMPVTPGVMGLAGHLAWAQGRRYYTDPDLHPFREWVHAHGKATYARFLVAHPATTLLEPFRDARGLVAPTLDYYRRAPPHSILPAALAMVLYLDGWPLLLVLGPLILVVAVASSVRLHTRDERLLLLSCVLVLLFYPHAAIAWHGDSNDVGRHALLASVHLRLGVWLLLISAADMLLMRTRSGRSDG